MWWNLEIRMMKIKVTGKAQGIASTEMLDMIVSMLNETDINCEFVILENDSIVIRDAENEVV